MFEQCRLCASPPCSISFTPLEADIESVDDYILVCIDSRHLHYRLLCLGIAVSVTHWHVHCLGRLNDGLGFGVGYGYHECNTCTAGITPSFLHNWPSALARRVWSRFTRRTVVNCCLVCNQRQRDVLLGQFIQPYNLSSAHIDTAFSHRIYHNITVCQSEFRGKDTLRAARKNQIQLRII